MLAYPNQTPGLKEQYALTRAQVDAAVWVIDETGRKWAGAAAVNRMWQECGPFWAALAWLYALRPVAWVEEQVYLWVANHRGLLSRFYSTTPECQRVECE